MPISKNTTTNTNANTENQRSSHIMPPDRSSFTPLNLPASFALPECMDYFTLTAGPNTDLWRKPPNGDISTAPIVFTSLRSPFVIAEVTVSADWEMEWDQGGLVIFAGAAPGSFSDSSTDHRSAQQPPPGSAGNGSGGGGGGRRGRRPLNATETTATARPVKWVKAGMEFCSGTVNASSVSATADGADWCLSPLGLPDRGPGAVHSLRIKLERIGHALWIWYQVPSASPYAPRSPGAVSSTWKKLREVTWFFYGVEDKFVHVGVYASRPNSLPRSDTMWAGMHGHGGMATGMASGMASGTGDGLMVEFEDLEIF